MARRTLKDDTKPDVIQTSFRTWIMWVKSNPSIAATMAVVIILIGVSIWGYVTYQSNENDKIQYTLSQAMNGFENFMNTGKPDMLAKTEAAFRTVAKKNAGGPSDIAELYLGAIAATKGNKQEAQTIYKGIVKNPSNSTVKKLAETALLRLDTK